MPYSILMSNYGGVQLSKHGKRFLKRIGGAVVLDKLNDELLSLHRLRYDDTIRLNGRVLHRIGDGLSRVVYGMDDVVLKFPQSANNRDNLNEWLMYDEMKRIGLHKNFATPVALLDGYRYGVVMVAEYVSGVGHRLNQDELTRKMKKRGSKVVALDLHNGNVRSGRVIDYGHFHTWDGTSKRKAEELREKLTIANRYLVD